MRKRQGKHGCDRQPGKVLALASDIKQACTRGKAHRKAAQNIGNRYVQPFAYVADFPFHNTPVVPKKAGKHLKKRFEHAHRVAPDKAYKQGAAQKTEHDNQ